jgi:hypothetical protein
MKKKLEINKPTQDILLLYEELLKSRYDWTNDYSQMYLKRKIAVCRELVHLYHFSNTKISFTLRTYNGKNYRCNYRACWR